MSHIHQVFSRFHSEADGYGYVRKRSRLGRQCDGFRLLPTTRGLIVRLAPDLPTISASESGATAAAAHDLKCHRNPDQGPVGESSREHFDRLGTPSVEHRPFALVEGDTARVDGL
jgi:hypothetical protein